MKIAFFLENANCWHVDCSHIKDGNPGMGGTEYMVVLISTLLSERYNGLDVCLLTQKEGQFMPCVKTMVQPTINEAISYAATNNYDYLVFVHKHSYTDGTDENPFCKLSSLISTSGLRLIPWCHIFVPEICRNYYSHDNNITNIVYVGKQQQELYIDHSSFRKSTYIYNAVNIMEANCGQPIAKRESIVTYVGNIIPYKGFHWLAKAWKDIVSQVPDAQLYVIGTGKLYGNNYQVGRLGIAEARYEEHFFKLLSTNNVLLPSVHFMGIMGKEKNDILSRTKVGVPNPCGDTETFGLTAVEFQQYGANVATMRCAGYIDTVFSGVLYSRKKELASAVVKLLKVDEMCDITALEKINERFSVEKIVTRWEQLFRDGRLEQTRKFDNLSFHQKWMKIVMHFLKSTFPLLERIPSVESVRFRVCRRIRDVKAKYHMLDKFDEGLNL